MSADEIARREHLVTELLVWAEVVPVLPLERLTYLRGWLRLPARLSLTEDAPMVRSTHAQVLEAVCRRLVDEHGWPEEYLIGAGDMPPKAPDDIASLTADGGPDDVS